jgi:hypothetical protein
MNTIIKAISFGNFRTCNAITIVILLFVSSTAIPLRVYSLNMYGGRQTLLAGTTFPPPIFYKLRNIPSYAITIPFTSSGISNFDPADISIPLGMTVIWFNDDTSLHSVTTSNTIIITNNSSHSTAPPEKTDSGPILPNVYTHIFQTWNIQLL